MFSEWFRLTNVVLCDWQRQMNGRTHNSYIVQSTTEVTVKIAQHRNLFFFNQLTEYVFETPSF